MQGNKNTIVGLKKKKKMHCRPQRVEPVFRILDCWCLSMKKETQTTKLWESLPPIHALTWKCIPTLDLSSIILAFTSVYTNSTKLFSVCAFHIPLPSALFITPTYYQFPTSQLPIILVPISLPEHLLLTICYGFILL